MQWDFDENARFSGVILLFTLILHWRLGVNKWDKTKSTFHLMPVFTGLALQEVTRQGLWINYSRCYATWYSLYIKREGTTKGIYFLGVLEPWDRKFENLSKRGSSCKFVLLCFTGRRRKKKEVLSRKKKQKKDTTVSSVAVNILWYLTTC